VGDTYYDRLWCLIEVYVSLEMGRADVKLISLGGSAAADVSSLDVRRAECSVAEDTQMLRGVFGDLDVFSICLRELTRTSTMDATSPSPSSQDRFQDSFGMYCPNPNLESAVKVEEE